MILRVPIMKCRTKKNWIIKIDLKQVNQAKYWRAKFECELVRKVETLNFAIIMPYVISTRAPSSNIPNFEITP